MAGSVLYIHGQNPLALLMLTCSACQTTSHLLSRSGTDADLVNQMEDAIGSVANYLKIHRWQKNQPVASDVDLATNAPARLINKKLKPNTTIGALQNAGVRPLISAPADSSVSLIQLEQEDQSDLYRIAFKNFYVITKYNRSLLYATAVYELMEAVRKLKTQS